MSEDPSSPSEPIYECVWPLGQRAATQIRPAQRIADLRGKKVAELWNYLFQGETIFPVIRAELSKRFPGVSFMTYENFGTTNGPQRDQLLAQLPQLLASGEVAAVISGVGA